MYDLWPHISHHLLWVKSANEQLMWEGIAVPTQLTTDDLQDDWI